MRKKIVVSAKTVKKAVEIAAKELGAPSSDEIEYTILEAPKHGFLGIGSSNAKISATYSNGIIAKTISHFKKSKTIKS